MSAHTNRPRVEPTPINLSAVENLRYIRSTIEAAHTFTTVPGKGCIAMGVVALAAVALESVPMLETLWLEIWLGAAIVAVSVALALWLWRNGALGVPAVVAAILLSVVVPPWFFPGAGLLVLVGASVVRKERRARRVELRAWQLL